LEVQEQRSLVSNGTSTAVWQECKTHLLENFKAVERQVNDESERIKTEIERDADELRQALTISKARQGKHIDNAVETLKAHSIRTQSTLTRCQVCYIMD